MISGLFLASSLAVIMTPGPDAALVTQLVLRFARRGPALVAAIGMLTAGALHAGLSASGVSLLLRAHSALFTAVRWLGAAVLFGWGVWTLRGWFLLGRSRSRPPGHSPDQPQDQPTDQPPGEPPVGAGRAYLLGLLSTGSNPKVGLFLLAFLPQFVPAGAAPGPAMVLLAAVYLAVAAGWLLVLTELVYQLRRRVPVPGLLRGAHLVTGMLFLAFAVRLALSSQ